MPEIKAITVLTRTIRTRPPVYSQIYICHALSAGPSTIANNNFTKMLTNVILYEYVTYMKYSSKCHISLFYNLKSEDSSYQHLLNKSFLLCIYAIYLCKNQYCLYVQRNKDKHNYGQDEKTDKTGKNLWAKQQSPHSIKLI